MYTQAATKLNSIPHNGAYGIVMRGVQKMHTGCSSLRCRNAAPLRRIKLDTATGHSQGNGGMLPHTPNNNLLMFLGNLLIIPPTF